ALKAARIALAPVIERAIETCRPSIEQMGQQLSTSLPAEPIYLSADAVRLSQVVANLLSNASKFTPREGRIWLTAECHRDEDGNKPHVLITVKDTGVGIPQNMLPHIFEMFAQVDQSLERSHSGLGIGLTLAQRLVELHGGSLEAHSDGPGLGSEFIVRLGVLGEPAQGASPDAAKRSAASAHRRILVVDDNRDAADSLATLLSLRGHSVRIAYDGATAVETASAFLPDLVLLDIGMPKLNGFNTAQRIRALPQTRNALLIAVTGWGQKEDKRRSQAAGFDAHLVKPVDYGALLALLDSFKAEAPTLENF
ncbi:MAG TPA: ATP-binding protein, partial [Gammaproteobacteria bacterium]|nr:ATP-binding protein [Gammaproteobacteria bacterium]